MQVWAALEFAFLLVVAIGVFSILIAKTRIIEKTEEEQWTKPTEKIEAIR